MKKLLVLALLFSVITLIPKITYAVGLGVHVVGGANIYKGYKEDQLGEKMFLGGGFTIDSTVAMNNLFNYRMHIDYTNSGNPSFLFGKHSHHIINLQNSFGFGVVRLPNFRFWLGPNVQFFHDFTENHFDVNAGLVLGFNINTGKLFTFSIDCGARVGLLEWRSDYGKKYTARIEPFMNISFLFRVKDVYLTEEKESIHSL
jgi:hypothetical protein